MKSSTLKRIGRISVAILAIAFWQFVASPIAFFMSSQVNGYHNDQSPVKFDTWAMYHQPYGTITQNAEIIFWIQLIGLMVTVIVGLILCGLYYLGGYIWFGTQTDSPVIVDETEEEYVGCTNHRCPCAYHKAEVFTDGEWDAPNCTDKNCSCAHHNDEVFDEEKGYWVMPE